MKFILLLLIIQAVIGTRLNVTQEENPHEEQSEIMEGIYFAKNLLNALFDGLGLDDFLGGEEACIDDIEVMLWYYYYTYEGIFMSEELYNGTLSLTKGLGRISPVVRKCYNFSEDNEAQWVAIADRVFNIENLWVAVRENLISSYSEVDNLAWGALLLYYKKEYVASLANFSKAVNLIVI